MRLAMRNVFAAGVEPWYLCITAESAGVTVGMTQTLVEPVQHDIVVPDLEYSLDGARWRDFVPGTTTVVLATAGGHVYFRHKGLGAGTMSYMFAVGTRTVFVYTSFTFSGGSVSVSGRISSLINGRVRGGSPVPAGAFAGLFMGCTGLVSAKDLVLPANATDDSLREMFSGCTSLVEAPMLPVFSAAPARVFYQMFKQCSSLTVAPALPATSLGAQCYSGMFMSCTALTAAPRMTIRSVGFASCYSMFNGCSRLESVPVEFLADTLASSCYAQMFYTCSRLSEAPRLPDATVPAGVAQCYNNMFSYCARLRKVTVEWASWPANCTTNWLSNTAYPSLVSDPEFYCPITLDTETNRDASHCPAGWTVVPLP